MEIHCFFSDCRKGDVNGSVRLNNIPLGSKKYSKMCSYILQEDNLFPSFTVYETMLMAANLKIADISTDEKNMIVRLIANHIWMEWKLE